MTKQSQDYVWTMIDGTPIRLGDMEDSHLSNTRNMLLRNVEERADSKHVPRWRRMAAIMEAEIYRREIS